MHCAYDCCAGALPPPYLRRPHLHGCYLAPTTYLVGRARCTMRGKAVGLWAAAGALPPSPFEKTGYCKAEPWPWPIAAGDRPTCTRPSTLAAMDKRAQLCVAPHTSQEPPAAAAAAAPPALHLLPCSTCGGCPTYLCTGFRPGTSTRPHIGIPAGAGSPCATAAAAATTSAAATATTTTHPLG